MTIDTCTEEDFPLWSARKNRRGKLRSLERNICKIIKVNNNINNENNEGRGDANEK